VNGSSPRPGSGWPRRLRLAAVGPASRLASGAVAVLAVAALLALGACAGPAASPGPTAAASPAIPSGTGPDWLGPAGSGDPAACATPAPSEQAGVCTDPAGSSSAAPVPGASGVPVAAPGAGGAATAGAQVPAVTGSGGAAAPVGGATVAASPSPGASPSPAASPSPSGSSDPSATASLAPSEAPPAGAAPTSAAGFKVRDTIVPMAFPLPATASYRYGDGWRAPRVGMARSYNQIRGVAPDGSYLRAHDGLDLLVKLKTPVLAPFAGRVIDPAKRWKPWDPSRYGTVVVIESTEPTSPGYAVILAHLSSVAVKVGDEVRRGQVVGKTGKTGNAAGTPPHLHLETRAPFRIRYGYAGVIRRLDVFDAEPSIRAADPKAR
jgi:murein DD-endopeptidase MepM/ murein hydrolase activator NlpD